jgi:hypothetical protein
MLQPFGLVHPQARVFLPPAIVGLVADAQFLADVRCVLTLGQLDFGLTQLRDDLLAVYPFRAIFAPFPNRPGVGDSNSGAGPI